MEIRDEEAKVLRAENEELRDKITKIGNAFPWFSNLCKEVLISVWGRATTSCPFQTPGQGRRFSDVEYARAMQLHLSCSTAGYDTVRMVFRDILPTTRSLQRHLQKQVVANKFPCVVQGFEEGKIRATFKQLESIYDKNGWSKTVVVAEDASSVSQAPRKKLTAQKCILYGLDVDCKSEFSTVEELDKLMDKFKDNAAKYVYVYAVSHPFQIGVPPFILAFFGTSNRFTTEDVLARWSVLHNAAEASNFQIVGHSSDGDARCMAAMRERHKSPAVIVSLSEESKLTVNLVSGKEMNVAGKMLNSSQEDSKHDTVFIQDGPHLILRFTRRTLGLRQLTLGPYISCGYLMRDLVPICGQAAILNKDPQNFKHARKLMSKPAIHALRESGDSFRLPATILELASKIFDAQVSPDPKISMLDRIGHLYGCIFFTRAWRRWLDRAAKAVGFKGDKWKFCITRESAKAVELNGQSFVRIARLCYRKGFKFKPWDFSSQRVEQFFRATRSFGGPFSTITNFNMLEFEQRVLHLQYVSAAIAAGIIDGNRSKRHSQESTCSDHGREALSCGDCTDENIKKSILGPLGYEWAQKQLDIMGIQWSEEDVVGDMFPFNEEAKEDANEDEEESEDETDVPLTNVVENEGDEGSSDEEIDAKDGGMNEPTGNSENHLLNLFV